LKIFIANGFQRSAFSNQPLLYLSSPAFCKQDSNIGMQPLPPSGAADV
jgi:hypothetical protein